MKEYLPLYYVLLALSVFSGCDNQQPHSTAGKDSNSEKQTPGGESLPAKNNLTSGDRQRWRNIIHWSSDCEEAFNSTMPADSTGIKFYSLAKQRYLVQITCTLGAYQGYQEYAYLDQSNKPTTVRHLVFQTIEVPANGHIINQHTEQLWGLAEFDSQKKRLSLFNRFRGMGDCGFLASYAFVNGSPELVEIRAKLSCDGHGPYDPNQWKLLEILNQDPD